MLLNRIWKLFVWEISGMSCAKTGETGSSFVVKGMESVRDQAEK